jgi:hypothetical protein
MQRVQHSQDGVGDVHAVTETLGSSEAARPRGPVPHGVRRPDPRPVC